MTIRNHSYQTKIALLLLLQKVCTSVGPPIYYWDRWLVGGGLSNVPSDKEASEL